MAIWPFAHVGRGGVKNGGPNFGNRTVVKIITCQCAIIPTVPSLVCSLCIRQDKITRLLKCDIEGDFEANEERWVIEYRPAMNVALWYWYPYDLLQFIHAFLCNSNLYLAGPSHVQVGRWQLGFFAMEREHREVHCCIRARLNCLICKIICLFEVAQQIRLWPLLSLILIPIGECSSDGKALGERGQHMLEGMIDQLSDGLSYVIVTETCQVLLPLEWPIVEPEEFEKPIKIRRMLEVVVGMITEGILRVIEVQHGLYLCCLLQQCKWWVIFWGLWLLCHGWDDTIDVIPFFEDVTYFDKCGGDEIGVRAIMLHLHHGDDVLFSVCVWHTSQLVFDHVHTSFQTPDSIPLPMEDCDLCQLLCRSGSFISIYSILQSDLDSCCLWRVCCRWYPCLQFWRDAMTLIVEKNMRIREKDENKAVSGLERDLRDPWKSDLMDWKYCCVRLMIDALVWFCADELMFPEFTKHSFSRYICYWEPFNHAKGKKHATSHDSGRQRRVDAW
jgi:hypothetical protein